MKAKLLTLSLKINNREFICDTTCSCENLSAQDCECVDDLLDALYTMEEDPRTECNKIYGAIIDSDVFEKHLEYETLESDTIN